MFDTSKSRVLQEGLNQLCSAVINPMIAAYGALKSISYTDGTLSVSFTLLGMEEVPMYASVRSLTIADDASTVTLGGCSANVAFLENALKEVSKKPIKVPDIPAVRAGLKIFKGILED